MGNKKDIGKIFQERFKDFEQAPESGIWNVIASELDRKIDRKIAPLWYYFGGSIIAILIVSMLVWQPWKNQQTDFNEDTKITSVTNTAQDDKNTFTQNDSLEYSKTGFTSKLEKNNKTLSQQKTKISETKGTSTALSSNTNTTQQLKFSVAKNSGITDNDQKKKSTLTNQSLEKYSTLTTIREALALNKIERMQKEKEAQIRYQEKITRELVLAIETQHQENVKSIRSLEIANKEKQQDNIVSSSKDKPIDKPIITNTKKEKKSPKSDYERAIDREEATNYEIAISPYTSLLRYGSLAKGSSIDDRLVDNPRDAIATTGYGLRMDYTLSEKSSLRFGVGVAPLKYRTDNFQVSINNGAINIYQLSGIVSQNLNQSGIITNPEALTFFNENQIVSIEQDISYIEIPIDYQYKFLNKRISLSINPGLSLLVLTNNSVYATANNGASLLIGQETDLNNLSLAFNLGLGANYNISKRWQFNTEPIFRYQLNPYNNSVSNFRPYYIGVQFGLSYKF